MAGRQLAWIRRADGNWIAIVTVSACSGSGLSEISMPLWLPPDELTVMEARTD